MTSNSSLIDQIDALKVHVRDREAVIMDQFSKLQKLEGELVACRRQVDDLQAANNRYLERARSAEESIRHERAAMNAILERAEAATHPDIVSDLMAFHSGCGTVDPVRPTVPDDCKKALRWSLLEEEIEELNTAVAADDIVEVADAIVDAVYILIGTALAWGIPFWPVWREVHRSNMDKFDPVTGVALRRHDGKILKRVGWTPPDVNAVIAKAMGA